MESIQARKHTCIERYNVDNVAKLFDVQQRRADSFAAKRNMLPFIKPVVEHETDASELVLYRINKSTSDAWLDTYHPLKHCPGTVLALGLIKDDTIYCMMTFKKSRNKQYVAELSRMWMLPGHNVVGGYSVLSEAASDFGIYNIVAYVNVLFEDEQDYINIGMTYTRDIQRTKWWVKNDDMISDASRRQSKRSIQSMIDDGYIAQYDCGQKVYVYDESLITVST